MGTCWGNQYMFMHRCCSPFLCSKLCSYGYGEGMVSRRKKRQLCESKDLLLSAVDFFFFNF